MNTVVMFFSVRTKKLPFWLLQVRRRQGSPGLEYTHQPWSSPREEGLRYKSSVLWHFGFLTSPCALSTCRRLSRIAHGLLGFSILAHSQFPGTSSATLPPYLLLRHSGFLTSPHAFPTCNKRSFTSLRLLRSFTDHPAVAWAHLLQLPTAPRLLLCTSTMTN